MEGMTTSSVLWPHAWDWRRLMWKMPYWRGIRYFTFFTLIENCSRGKTRRNRCGGMCNYTSA